MKALYIKDFYTGHVFYSTIMITITQQKLCVKFLLLYRDYIELYSDVVGLCFSHLRFSYGHYVVAEVRE
jgi:hypothetical protein